MTALDRDLTKSELRGALREAEAAIEAALAVLNDFDVSYWERVNNARRVLRGEA